MSEIVFTIAGGVLLRCRNQDGTSSVYAKTITIPEGVTRIADTAFHGCYRLEEIIVPESVTSIGSALDNCFFLYKINGIPMKELFANCHVYREKAMKILITKDVYANLLPDEKYPLIWKMFLLWPECRTVLSYLDKKCTSMCKYLIRTDDIDTMRRFLDLGKFLSKKNIDILISYAIDHQKYEFQVMLTEYKNNHIGYEDTEATLRKKFKL